MLHIKTPECFGAARPFSLHWLTRISLFENDAFYLVVTCMLNVNNSENNSRRIKAFDGDL